MNTRKCGSFYEQKAANFLAAKGYIILEKNFRCKFGEIDLIALDREALVFAEVKYRSGRTSGYPEEAVSFYKQRKISQTADYYCMKNKISERADRRFDVIAIDGGNIRHHVNAFMYCRGRTY